MPPPPFSGAPAVNPLIVPLLTTVAAPLMCVPGVPPPAIRYAVAEVRAATGGAGNFDGATIVGDCDQSCSSRDDNAVVTPVNQSGGADGDGVVEAVDQPYRIGVAVVRLNLPVDDHRNRAVVRRAVLDDKSRPGAAGVVHDRRIGVHRDGAVEVAVVGDANDADAGGTACSSGDRRTERPARVSEDIGPGLGRRGERLAPRNRRTAVDNLPRDHGRAYRERGSAGPKQRDCETGRHCSSRQEVATGTHPMTCPRAHPGSPGARIKKRNKLVIAKRHAGPRLPNGQRAVALAA